MQLHLANLVTGEDSKNQNASNKLIELTPSFRELLNCQNLTIINRVMDTFVQEGGNVE